MAIHNRQFQNFIPISNRQSDKKTAVVEPHRGALNQKSQLEGQWLLYFGIHKKIFLKKRIENLETVYSYY